MVEKSLFSYSGLKPPVAFFIINFIILTSKLNNNKYINFGQEKNKKDKRRNDQRDETSKVSCELGKCLVT